MLKVSKLTVGVVLLCATSAHAVELPAWNVARICAAENADGQCRIFESEAKRTITGGWSALPDAYRSACLEEIKEPYASYRSLSQCLEQQARQGRGLREIRTAATRADRSASGTPSHGGKIETLEDYFKLRDSWGQRQEGSLQARPIRFAALPSPVTDALQPFLQITERFQDDDGKTEAVDYSQNPETSLPVMIATAGSLAEFLAERDGWGKGLILAQAETSETTAQESTSQSTTDVPRDQIDKALAALLAERESWGTEPSRRTAEAAPPASAEPRSAAAESKPAVTEASETPQLNDVPRNQIDKALSELLAEREGWGAGPAATTATTASEEPGSPSAADEAPVTDLAGYLARRDSWGTGSPSKPVNAPLAAGAVTPLPKAAPSAAPASDTPVIAHPVEVSPVPQLTEVPRADIDRAMAELLAERESWSAPTPAASSQDPQPGVQSADASACEAQLRETMSTGTVLFGINSATLDAASFTTLDQVFERAQPCQNAFISIEGHTDDVGSDAENNRLSEQRAQAVMNYLIEKGINSSRVEAVGFGESRPLVPNTSAENRAKNRRIELRVR